MSVAQYIEEIITPSLLDKGFGVVRVQFSGATRKTLQIMIERQDEQAVSVADCTDVSHIVSVLLDVNDPIHESYVLEVSSPGLDRPLVKREDFEKYQGSMIKVDLKTPYKGSRRYTGVLRGIEGDSIKIDLASSEKNEKSDVAVFSFSDVLKAKLIPKS